jgi:hypothetical protein
MNDDIVIEVFKSCMDYNRYGVHAHYKGTNKNIAGDCYFDGEGILYKWFKIGESTDTKLKRATCEAIDDLKLKYTEHKQKSDFMDSLNKIASDHAKNCKSGE